MDGFHAFVEPFALFCILFQALEKAIGDAMPNSARQMEPILKQVRGR